jgi:hypothetical protein
VIDRARPRSLRMTMALRYRISLLGLVMAAWAAAPALARPLEAGTQRAELERNRSLWTSQHLRDYRFRLRVQCFCPDAATAVTVIVRDGRPRGATGFRKRFDTMPELFAALDRSIGDPRAGDVSVRYSARRGFPRSAFVDAVAQTADEEFGWSIDRFRPLRPR